jgi:hypothetical protein
MKRLLLISFLFCGFSAAHLHAQQAEAEAVLMKEQARIGEPIELKLFVRYTEGSSAANVYWPEMKKGPLAGDIEILSADSVSKRLVNRASVLYEQSRTLTITAFDSGTYVIPPIKFAVNGDTIKTVPVRFYISTVAVDTTKPIKDIKEIYDVPAAPVVEEEAEAVSWWVWALAGAALLGIIAFVIWLTRRKKVVPVVPPANIQLPHERVLEQLAQLGAKKPWLHGELKGYHVSLAEIMRGWLVERYRIHAREMTTADIVRSLRSEQVPSTAIEQANNVLRTADMVKFAKSTPANEENERSLQQAITFVQSTAIIPQPVPTPPKS